MELNSSRNIINPGREGKRRDGSLFSYLHQEKNKDIELLSCFGKINEYKLVKNQSIRVCTNVLRYH